ncbi:MAG: hypothetical protein ACKVUT_14145 [Gaiella sp.]
MGSPRVRRLGVLAALLTAVALVAALAVVQSAAAGRIVYTNVVPSQGAKEFTIRVHKPASFRIRLRVPTQGRARLYLLGATAPSGGPLIDTKTYDCEGTAGSFFCSGAFEPLPAGRYTFKLRWDGPQKASFELIVRW